MKKIAPIFCLIGILSSFVSVGQVSIIQRDFKDTTLKNRDIDTTVQIGEKYRIKIINVNRKLYKIDGVKTETDFNIAVPSVLSSIKAPSFIRLEVPQPFKDAAAAPGAIPDSATILAGLINSSLDHIKEVADFYERAQYYNNDLIDLLSNCESKTDTIMALLYDRTYELLNKQLSNRNGNSNTINHLLGAVKPNLNKALFKNLEIAENELSQLENNIARIKIRLPIQFDELLSDQKESRTKNLKGLNDKRLGKADVKRLKTAIHVSDSTITGLILQKHNLHVLYADFDQQLKEATELVAEIRKFVKEGKSQIIFKNFSLVANEGNFTYLSEVLTAKKDETALKVTIIPSELLTCGTNEKIEYNVSGATYRGLKIDFSTNLFINHGGENFLGRTYYYKNIDSTSRKIVSADRGVRAMLSIGALMHFYTRTTNKYKAALSIGASTTAEFTDLNFHAGPSLIIGNKDRFIISAGITLKTSKMLDRNLKMESTYKKSESPDEIPTVSVFPKFGAFISLGYNLSRFASK